MIGRVVATGLELMRPSGRTIVLIRVTTFQAELPPTTRFANQAAETKPTENEMPILTIRRSAISPELTSRLALKSVHAVRVFGAVHPVQVPLRQLQLAESPIRPCAMIVASVQGAAPRRHEYRCRTWSWVVVPDGVLFSGRL